MHRTLALPLFLIPGIATADITPQDVWDNLTATYAAMGMEMTGTPTVTGDTLVASGGALQVTYPIIGGGLTLSFPDMTITDNGDGTVQITTPDVYAMDFAADVPGEAEQITATVTVSQSGMNATASGDPGDITYKTDIADYDLLVNNISVPGEEGEFILELDTDGYTGETRITQQPDGTISLTSAMLNRDASTKMQMNFAGIEQTSTGTGGTIATNLNMVLPPNMNILNLTPALMAGLSISGDAVAEGSTSESTTMMDGAPMSTQSQTIGASTTSFGMDKDGFRISGTGESFTAEILDQTMMPFPIAFSGGNVTFDFDIPLVASETPQDFTYAFALNDVSVDDSLWMMIDQTQALSREPASLGIDVTGSLNWGLDVFDVAAYPALEQSGEVPITVNSVDIRNISVAVLGAMAKATGDFILDNDDYTTIPGFPRPEGSAVIEASGINAAMDQLLAAGLISESDLGPARMMMGLFSRVTGDDSLETTVEINAEGHVMVNGQRMR